MYFERRLSRLIYLTVLVVLRGVAESTTTQTPTAVLPASSTDVTLTSTEQGTTEGISTQPTSDQSTAITTTTVITSTDTTESQETTTELSTIMTTENTENTTISETSSSDPTILPHTTSEISTTDNNMSTEETTIEPSSTTSSPATTSFINDTITTTQDTNVTATTSPDATSSQPNTTTNELITTEITQQSTSSTDSVDSTSEITTTVKTTTQPVVTTTKQNQLEAFYPSIENAVLDFTFKLRFQGCSYNRTSIEKELSDVSSTVIGCEYIRVKSINSCASVRRKRSTTVSYVSVDTVFGINAERGVSSGSNVSNELYTALSKVDGIDAAYLNDSRNNLTDSLTSQTICDADTCRSALIGRPGYVCVNENINNTQRCTILYYCYSHPIDCGENGQCYVETEIRSGQASYVSKCRCKEEDYFRYEGSRCTDRVITWQLAVIICASGAGVLVLILLFVIISLCCRNSSNSADVSFDESELIYSPSGITSLNQYKNGRTRGGSAKGIENGAYMEVRETSASGSWRPEDSANTYANIDSKLRESNYKIQIKRPQVSQHRKSDEITEF